MSKHISTIPISSIERIQVYINQGRKSLAQIKVATGADYIINGGLYEGSRAVCHLKVDGRVWATDPYSYDGYAWDGGSDICMEAVPAKDVGNYICCVALLKDRKPLELTYNPDVGGSRQRSSIGLMGDKLCLYCSTQGRAPEALRSELEAMGWDSAVMLDGGGSSQCDFAGERITSSRKVHNLILVYLKKNGNLKPPEKEEPVNNYKVCLDPGHGVETAGKCAPDKSYYEHEFNLDMAKRLKVLLERHSIAATLTREDLHDITLEQRVKVANATKDLNLFVSIHSNASGDGKNWTSPDGYGIYTSAAGGTAARNIAAGKVLAQVKAAGIKLWGNGLFHELWYVCKNTVAPAILIEHGFHTNRVETDKLKDNAYRQKLAEVDCKGILDYLGVVWVDEPAKEPEKPSEVPWYAGDQKWVIEQGISDGTRPEDSVSRAEVWAMLHRMSGIK